MLRIIFFLPFFLISCSKTDDIKRLKWKEYEISLSVSNGGATTSWLWEIKAVKDASLFKSQSIIFSSYSSPFIEDIEIAGDTLKIICLDLNSKIALIDINLNYLETYIN